MRIFIHIFLILTTLLLGADESYAISALSYRIAGSNQVLSEKEMRQLLTEKPMTSGKLQVLSPNGSQLMEVPLQPDSGLRSDWGDIHFDSYFQRIFYSPLSSETDEANRLLYTIVALPNEYWWVELPNRRGLAQGLNPRITRFAAKTGEILQITENIQVQRTRDAKENEASNQSELFLSFETTDGKLSSFPIPSNKDYEKNNLACEVEQISNTNAQRINGVALRPTKFLDQFLKSKIQSEGVAPSPSVTLLRDWKQLQKVFNETVFRRMIYDSAAMAFDHIYSGFLRGAHQLLVSQQELVMAPIVWKLFLRDADESMKTFLKSKNRSSAEQPDFFVDAAQRCLNTIGAWKLESDQH